MKFWIRSSIFGGDRAGMVVEVHGGLGPTEAETEYRIEGSFSQRCCKVRNVIKFGHLLRLWVSLSLN
jgi:hypothetical protein